MNRMRQGGPRWRQGIVAGLLAAATLVGHVPASALERFKPFTLKNVDGRMQTLGDVLGKATLIVFFFPTCPYCNAAFPAVQQLHDRYRDRGLSVVSINVMPDEEPLIAGWRNTHAYTVPILLGTRSVARDYKLTMTPTHVLLDGAGRVLAKQAGYRPGDEQRLTRQVEQALGLAP